MTAPGRGGRNDGGAGIPSGGTATIRGAVLIAIAVLVGAVLLGKGFDSGFLPSDAGTPGEQAGGDNGDDDGGGDATSTTAATPTTHPAAQVRVQALNGGGPQGSAGAARERLVAAGYNALDAANAAADVAASSVFFAPGFEADAAAVATALGIAAPPQPLPTPPPAPAVEGQVDVVVVLGPDFVAG